MHESIPRGYTNAGARQLLSSYPNRQPSARNDDQPLRTYSGSIDIAASCGSSTENVVPRRSPFILDRTRIEPPCFSTSCLHTHNPRPFPTVPLVVKKGSKMLLVVSTVMPVPPSATAIRT